MQTTYKTISGKLIDLRKIVFIDEEIYFSGEEHHYEWIDIIKFEIQFIGSILTIKKQFPKVITTPFIDSPIYKSVFDEHKRIVKKWKKLCKQKLNH